MRFEDAIRWVGNPNSRGIGARRGIWADIPDYTRTTPPLNIRRRWHISMCDTGNIIVGWGGSIVGAEIGDDPVRDGAVYLASDEDRIATDWELWEVFEGKWIKR